MMDFTKKLEYTQPLDCSQHQKAYLQERNLKKRRKIACGQKEGEGIDFTDMLISSNTANNYYFGTQSKISYKQILSVQDQASDIQIKSKKLFFLTLILNFQIQHKPSIHYFYCNGPQCQMYGFKAPDGDQSSTLTLPIATTDMQANFYSISSSF
jgi:hypothetical protein